MWFRTGRLFVWCLILRLAAGWLVAGDLRKSPHPVLGTGRGLDHVGILVTNLDEAGALFSKRLGFTVDAGGKLPFGAENATIDFADESFLELIAITDRSVAQQRKPGLVRYLDQGEGGAFVVLDVSSARKSYDFLTSRGLRLMPPGHVSMTYPGVAEPAPGWTSLFFEVHPLRGDPLFFIEYDPWREFQERHPEFKPDTRHANGALRLRAAWMAVDRLEDAGKACRKMGFTVGRRRYLEFLGAHARRVTTGAGEVLLVSPVPGRDPYPDFLGRHEGGIVGVTIEVRDLRVAEAVIQVPPGFPLCRDHGIWGRSLLLEPAVTHGLWIEFVEQPRR
jgi:catechol 2,3-dioxygenase-like lactoylglutathione lyase family enzyme